MSRFGINKIYKNYMGDNESSRQIIVAENGTFLKTRLSLSSVGFVTRKINPKNFDINTDNGYTRVKEEKLYLEEKPYMVKKIPKGLLNTILKFYQVYAKKNSEVKINVWYDKVNDEFFLDCPFQNTSSVSVVEYHFGSPEIVWSEALINKYPEKYALRERLLNEEIELVLETHSHHNMGCSFSGVDDIADYYHKSGVHLSGVYITVIENPRLHLRYFCIADNNRSGERSSLTKKQDEVLFKEEDIVDFEDTRERNYDFNLFAKHVDIRDPEIITVRGNA